MFCSSVLALPELDADSTWPPADAMLRSPVTASSRPTITTTIQTAQGGMRPIASSTISAVETSSLSASGSSSLPMWVTILPRRASQPSSRSETAATMKIQAITVLPCSPGNSGSSNSTGTTAARSIVMVLGAFQKRSRGGIIGSARSAWRESGGADRADVATPSLSSEIDIVCAIVVENPIHVILRLLVRRHPTVAIDRARARVVGRQRAREIAIAIDHRLQVLGAAPDVRFRLERMLDAEQLGGLRHQLHQPLGSLARDGAGIEGRLGSNHRLHQRGRHAVAARRLVD